MTAELIEHWLPENPPMHHEDFKRTVFGRHYRDILDDTTANTMVEVYKAALKYGDRARRYISGNKWQVNFFLRGAEFGRKTQEGESIVLYAIPQRIPSNSGLNGVGQYQSPIQGRQWDMGQNGLPNGTTQIQPLAQVILFTQYTPGPSARAGSLRPDATPFIPSPNLDDNMNSKTYHSTVDSAQRPTLPLSTGRSQFDSFPSRSCESNDPSPRSPRSGSASSGRFQLGSLPFGSSPPNPSLSQSTLSDYASSGSPQLDPLWSKISIWGPFTCGRSQPTVASRRQPQRFEPFPEPDEGAVIAEITNNSVHHRYNAFMFSAPQADRAYKPNEAYAQLLEGSVEEPPSSSGNLVSDGRYGAIGDRRWNRYPSAVDRPMTKFRQLFDTL